MPEALVHMLKTMCCQQLINHCWMWKFVLAVALAAALIGIAHMHMIHLTTVLLSVLAVLVVAWCAWTIMVFQNILNWWKNMQAHVDLVQDLLQDTKQQSKTLRMEIKQHNE